MITRASVFHRVLPLFSRRLLLMTALLPLASPLVAAVETWTDLNGKPMQAEFVSLNRDYVQFRKVDGSRSLVHYSKLTPADRARIDVLTGKSSNAISASSDSATNHSAAAVLATATPSKIASAVEGRLVGVRNGRVGALSRDALADTNIYAIYFSASWCGPCRSFTPELVSGYRAIKQAHPEFELIFVSCDQTENDMNHYMIDDRMPWTALHFRETKTDRTFSAYQAPGIPNLVFIDGMGKVLSKSYDDHGQYLGPGKVLADIRRHFRM